MFKVICRETAPCNAEAVLDAISFNLGQAETMEAEITKLPLDERLALSFPTPAYAAITSWRDALEAEMLASKPTSPRGIVGFAAVYAGYRALLTESDGDIWYDEAEHAAHRAAMTVKLDAAEATLRDITIPSSGVTLPPKVAAYYLGDQETVEAA